MLQATLRRLAQSAKESARRAPLTIANNPYKTRKVWPPNFQELSPQQQLRYEKKYKRRVYMAHHSEKWDKGVRILRFVMISGRSQSCAVAEPSC